MTTPFSEPSAGERLNARDIVGQLIIARPTEYLTGVQTPFSASADAIKLDIVQVAQDEVTYGVLWFQGRLIGAFKNSVGQLFVGRIVTGQARPNMSPPYIFESLTNDQGAVQAASNWLSAHPDFLKPVQPHQQPDAYPVQQPLPAQGLNAGQSSVLDRLRQQGQQPFSASPGFEEKAPF